MACRLQKVLQVMHRLGDACCNSPHVAGLDDCRRDAKPVAETCDLQCCRRGFDPADHCCHASIQRLLRRDLEVWSVVAVPAAAAGCYRLAGQSDSMLIWLMLDTNRARCPCLVPSHHTLQILFCQCLATLMGWPTYSVIGMHLPLLRLSCR